MAESHPQAPRLWSLHHDGERRVVISAPDERQAMRIGRALQDLGDLPAESPLAVHPSTTEVSRRVNRAAQTAKLDESFLACLGDGVFITQICGGLP